MDIKNILINKISPSPINPRKSFDGAACPDEKSGDVININDAYKMCIRDRVYVEGEIRSRSFEDKNGVRHTVVEIFAESMEMVTVKQQTQHASSDDELPC